MERLGLMGAASAVPMRLEDVALAGVAVTSAGAIKVAGFPSAELGFGRCGLAALAADSSRSPDPACKGEDDWGSGPSPSGPKALWVVELVNSSP